MDATPIIIVIFVITIQLMVMGLLNRAQHETIKEEIACPANTQTS